MKLRELYTTAKAKHKTALCRFMRDMKRAGLLPNMRYYEGRFFYRGPAVRVDNIQDALSNTKVPCQWDNLGLGYIVYPKERL